MNKKTTKRGFTLVELLLVIAIISIIASLGVGVMAQAQEDAAIAATRSRMTLIQKILEIELEDYEVRRSPVSFANIGALITASTLDNSPTDKTLLHAKNLKRMIIADLIRAEMPDGSRADDDGRLSQFPSDTLLDYLGQIGVPRASAVSVFPIVPGTFDGAGNFESALPSVQGWAGAFSLGIPPYSGYDLRTPGDSASADGIDEEAADKSELLYQILLNIDIDGVPAVDQLGQAIGNTDGDNFPEIVDAWGEPIFLQWQQEWPILAPVPAAPHPDAGKLAINLNIWEPATGGVVLGGLSKEHVELIGMPNPSNGLYCKPVLPTQIRPFLVSERLIAVDGLPVDYQVGVDFSD